MKKYFKYLLFILVIFLLVGCSNEQGNKEFTYKFIVNDVVIKEGSGPRGTLIEFPDSPTKEGNAEFSYEFSKWDNNAKQLDNKDEVFNPEWNQIKNKYKVTFLGYDNKVLKEEEVEYGAKATAPTVEAVDATAIYKLTFTKWDKEIVEVTGDQTYKAEYIKTQNELSSLKNLKVSILGDSISTFYLEGSTYNNYYETGYKGQKINFYPTNSDTVKRWNQTWWGQLISNTRMKLGINNSWSGSFAYDYYKTSEEPAMTDARCSTLSENGVPDIVIVFIGTNDVCSDYPDYYTDKEYTIALNTIIDNIHKYCSEYTDIFFVNLYLSTQASKYKPRINMYNEVIEKVAEENNCGIIDYNTYMASVKNQTLILPDWTHPSLTGCTILANASEKAISEYYGIEYNKQVIPD